MQGPSSSYVPPALDELDTSPADATEDTKAPLLSREAPPNADKAPHESHTCQQAVETESTTSEESVELPPPPVVTATGVPFTVTGQVVAPGLPYPSAENREQDVLPMPEVPDARRLWRKHYNLLNLWLVLSVLSLLLFWPFYLAAGFFVGAEVAAVLGIIASTMHVSRSCAGMDLAQQIRVTAMFGTAASLLDMLTIVLNIMIVTSLQCSEEDEEECQSVVMYVVFFCLYLLAHGYLSMYIAKQARTVQQLLNPVSSGVVSFA